MVIPAQLNQFDEDSHLNIRNCNHILQDTSEGKSNIYVQYLKYFQDIMDSATPSSEIISWNFYVDVWYLNSSLSKLDEVFCSFLQSGQ